jgi:hypothetical protein
MDSVRYRDLKVAREPQLRSTLLACLLITAPPFSESQRAFYAPEHWAAGIVNKAASGLKNRRFTLWNWRPKGDVRARDAFGILFSGAPAYTDPRPVRTPMIDG